MKLTFGLVAVMFISMLTIPQAWAGHPGQNWDELEPDPVVRAWMGTLMQPDTPPDHPTSCCGSSDAYWADKVSIIDGEVYATVEDNRDDVKLGRAHVPNGTQFKIPPNKVVGERQRGNPSGHGVLFLGGVYWVGGEYKPDRRAVLCFVPNAGF